MSSRTAVQDRLAAILRDAQEPLTTRELGNLVGRQAIWSHDYEGCQVEKGVAAVFKPQHVECLGDVDVVFMSGGLGSHLRDELDALERQHLVRRSKAGRLWLWEWAGTGDVDMTMFEAAVSEA